jgi:glycosyltransferase involved in cell wall biosynthesis
MLREEYEYDIELIIISSLHIDNYATKKSVNDISQVRKFILENNQWIKFFSKLKNSEVLEWMKKSHVGLLPTYADTFGYSVLEFQAAGCPVISTNIRSLPEINNNDSGWMIKIPKNYLGEAIYSTKEDRYIISKLIRKGLEQAVHEIFSDKKIILEKSNNAIDQIKKNHSTQKYSEQLSEIYCKAFQ